MTDTASSTGVGMAATFGDMLRRDRQNRAPDVLNTIANLSSDEVFTPPEFANKMLDTLAESWASEHDGDSIWADQDVTFLDPATKSGVFLREIVKRLVEGQGNPPEGSNERKELVDRVLTRQVFGIGMTTLTALVARRSIYCSRDATSKHSVAPSFGTPEGNIWFERTQHTWTRGTPVRKVVPTSGAETLEYPTCEFCPATRQTYQRGSELETHAYALIHTNDPTGLVHKLYGAEMHFDVVIGNPPYQLGDSGGESVGSFAMPIYQKFVQAAKSLEPRYLTMVTPSRWFAGGRGLDDYRAEMLSDHRLKVLVDFPDSRDVFPGVDISGGVSYFLWSSAYDGPCKVASADVGGVQTAVKRYLDEYDILVRNNEAVTILHKVQDDSKKANLGSKVAPIQPFNIRTSFRGKESDSGMVSPVTLYQNGGTGFVERKDIPRNLEWVDEWKVLVSATSSEHGGQVDKSGTRRVLSRIIVAGPDTACTETYLVASRFASQNQAENFAKFLRTKLVRLLISLRTNTQHLYSDRFSFVPDLPMDRAWTDEDLYTRYDLSSAEIAYVESSMKAMTNDATATTETDH